MLRKRIGIAVAVLALCAATAFAKGGPVHVKAHTTKKGVHVKAHVRSAPNKTEHDNFGSKGNVNPSTGKVGTKQPTH